MPKRIAMLLVVGVSAVALAQKQPDFSGVWMPDAIKTSVAAGTGGTVALPPSDLTIQHTPAALAVSQTAFDIVTTQTYKLDGGESTTKTGAVTRLSRNRWDGSRLVIEGKASQVTSAGYSAWTFKETYSLDSRGRLILETEHKASDGTVISSTREYTRKRSK